MKHWILTWERSVNSYSELHYRGQQSISEVIYKWRKDHPKRDESCIVRVELL